MKKETGENKSGKTVEESFAELEEILAAMQAEEMSLEDSFRCYEKGMKLVREINVSLDAVEKKVKQIAADGSLSDFEA